MRCYGFDEVIAEKIRALHERERPRDLYDVVSLFRRGDLAAPGRRIHGLLVEKCASKGILPPSRSDLSAPKNPAELRADWDSMLAHQLPDLPPIESFLAEQPRIVAWLFDGVGPETLPEISAGSTTDGIDATWRPPPTMWVWGEGVPIETIRFAAANRLCIDLGYEGSTRRVEPYSLRRTQSGHVLLFAVKSETGEVRSYRVDRLESATVVGEAFTPRFQVEMNADGALGGPPKQRRKTRDR